MRDIAIIGAGPVGLYSATAAGLRGLTGYLFESCDCVGGQPSSMFAQKDVKDIPAYSSLTGEELIHSLKKQYKNYRDLIELKLNTEAKQLEKIKGGWRLHTNSGSFDVRTILIAAGMGSSSPRLLGVDGEKEADITYSVSNISDFYNKKVVIFGGGDSAVDWANMLEGKSEVTIIHRRDEFRGNAGAVSKVREHANVLTPYSPVSIGSNVVTIKNNKDETAKEIEYDSIIVQFGQITGWGEMANWGCEMDKNKFKVNGWAKTSVDGIWAVGNACMYEGKIGVITSGFGEVTSAIASIATRIDPSSSPLFFSSIEK